jgi:hypothetical protein
VEIEGKMAHSSDERKFLHDLAGHLGAAVFMIDIILERVSADPSFQPETKKQVEKVNEALAKVRQLIEERRSILIQRQVSSGD